MVSILQRVLAASQQNGYPDEEFFAHLALAKKLPESNHVDLALKAAPKSDRPEKVIAFLFECTVCSYESCLHIITQCPTKQYRARAYCIVATRFPDKKEECLERALRDVDQSDKTYYQIACTFQNVDAASKISRCYKRTMALLEICLGCLETNPTKADRSFRLAVATQEFDLQICDLFRAVAVQANLLNLREGAFYIKRYFLVLQKMETKTQASHCKQLFREVVAKNTNAAVAIVYAANQMPVITTQGALTIAEVKKIDVFKLTEMITLAKKSLATLGTSSFKSHAAIRLSVLLKSARFPKGVDKDIVTTARWMEVLFSMDKKKKLKKYITGFPSQVKAYLEGITTASSELYQERRDTLLKAALKLIKHFPDIALELVRLALPALANDRLYSEHLEAVAAFACKQTASIQERIINQIAQVLTRDKKLHDERPDCVRLYIEFATALLPLSSSLALQCIARARVAQSRWNPDELADALGSNPEFQNVQAELYEEALENDPNNVTLMIKLAQHSPPEKMEELLGKALDAALSNRDDFTPRYLQGIILNAL